MSFGFKSINDDLYVQIDSEYPRLACIYSGDYAAVGSYVVTVTFPRPVTTLEPPCIFIRPTTTSSRELYRDLIVNGSVGNWTGFTIRSSNVTFRPSGKWFAAVFGVTSSADFGLRLFDENSKPVFDSNSPAIIVTKVSPYWTYAGIVSLEVSNAYYWRTPVSAEEGEYIMINPFSRPLPSPTTVGSTCGLRVGYNGAPTEIYALNLNVWTDIGYIPAVLARLVKP